MLRRVGERIEQILLVIAVGLGIYFVIGGTWPPF